VELSADALGMLLGIQLILLCFVNESIPEYWFKTKQSEKKWRQMRAMLCRYIYVCAFNVILIPLRFKKQLVMGLAVE